MEKGLIVNIQRMSTEDGPGLRTTVFFKGCPLSCAWCHNPESISFKKEREWFAARCMLCRTCQRQCANQAISFDNGGLKVNEDLCELCMKCTAACPTNALEAKGVGYGAQELFGELMKDAAYFGKDGGVTLSGGEALMQRGFTSKLLKLLHAAGVHTAVDTCGLVDYSSIDAVYDDTSLFLYDLKLMDSALHKKYTGAGNEIILQNLSKLAQKIRSDNKAKLWIRTPLIPNITDTAENIDAIALFLEDEIGDCLARWELLEFNSLCASKYERLGKEWDFADCRKQSEEKIDEIMSMIGKHKNTAPKTFVAGRKITQGAYV